jgi:hypothetical protein
LLTTALQRLRHRVQALPIERHEPAIHLRRS